MSNLTKQKAARLSAAIVLSLVASACASGGKFACPAKSTGYGCKSALEIYEITDQPGVFNARQPTAREQRQLDRQARREAKISPRPAGINTHAASRSGQAMSLAGPVQQHTGAFVNSAALSLGGSASTLPASPHQGLEATAVARLPAQVMRIWVAPWTDEAGDLHQPSHIYTEIVGRRWAVGGDVRADGTKPSFDPNGPMYPSN